MKVWMYVVGDIIGLGLNGELAWRHRSDDVNLAVNCVALAVVLWSVWMKLDYAYTRLRLRRLDKLMAELLEKRKRGE